MPWEISRSPLAEGILRSKISENIRLQVQEQFLFMKENILINVHQNRKEHGVDISHQRANYFTEKHLEDFDKIFLHGFKNLEDVLSKAKSEEQRNKVF